MEFYDKKGIPLRPFDIVKVFHFTGARKKKNYMYKQVVEKFQDYGWTMSHLEKCAGTYSLRFNDKINLGYEIVQGFGEDGVPFDEREREKDLPKVDHSYD